MFILLYYIHIEVILVSTRKGAKKMVVWSSSPTKATTRDALVAATSGFLQRGSEVDWGFGVGVFWLPTGSTWMIIPVSKWLGSSPFITHETAIWKGKNPT